MKILKILAIIGLVSLAVHFQVRAGTTIGLEGTSHYPDFSSVSHLTLSYTAGGTGNNFQALGYTDSYTVPGGTADASFMGDYGSYATWSFDVEANITPTGSPYPGFLNSGTLTITGSLDGGTTYETLLTGTLIGGNEGTAFGAFDAGAYPAAEGDYFEFQFNVTGGDSSIVSDFGGLGSKGGVGISANFGQNDTVFDGSWATSFSNGTGSATADAFALPVPEPSSILLVLVGSALLVGGHRCRRSALGV